MSKSIDERVVEMRFDNSNFAKNVKDTMNQVSDLNKSLNSIEPGSAEDSLLRIATAAEGLQKRFSVVGTAIGRIVENITDTIQQKVTSLMSYVTNGIKSGGISRAMKLEAAKFQLEGLLTDAEKEAGQLDAIMANVNTGVSDTAYGLDAAASVASQLAATGMRAGEEMEHTLVGISGVAAMTGSTYEEIGHIYTTISGQGKLMGIQLTQLATRGLNAAAILAKSLNITEAEVRELVSDGKISFAQFSEAMYDAFGVHAKAANKTFTGAMSNIRAALAKIGAMFIQPLIANEGPLVDMLNAIRVWLNDLRNYLGPLAKGFQDTIGGIANWVKDLFSVKLASPFRIFSNYLDGAGVKMDDFIEYMKEAGDAAKFPIRATIQEYGSLEKALSSGKIDKSIVMDAIHRMTGEAESAHNALGKTTRTAEDYYDIVHKIWIEGAYGHTETRWKRLEEEGWDAMYVQQLVNDSVYSGYINLERLDDEHLRATGISKEHTEILKGLQKQAEETGIPIEDLVDDMLRPSGHELFFAGLYNIGKAVANIFTAIGNAYRRIFPTKSRDQLYQIIKGFYDFTDALANNEEVCKALESTFAGIFAVLDIIITFIKGVATAVLKGVGTVITELAGGVFEATGAFGEGLVAIRDWIKEHNILLEIITNIINVIAFLIVAIVKFVRYIASLPVVVNVFNKIRDAFGKIFNAIGGYFEKLGNWIADTVAHFESLDEITFDDVIAAMKDFYNNFIKVIGVGIKDAFVALWDSLPSFGDILMAGLTKFKDGVSKFFDAFRGGAVTAAKSTATVGSAFFDVIKEIFSGIFGFAKDLITKALPALWDFVKELGPIGTMVTIFVTTFVYDALRVTHAVASIIGDIHGILRQVKQAVDQYGKLLRARRQNARADVILKIAVAIAILAGALILLSKADPDRLMAAGKVLFFIALGVTVLAVALGKLSDATKNVRSFDRVFDFKNGIFGKRNYSATTQQVSKILLSFAASILLIVVAIKMIADLDEDDLKRGAIVVGVIAAVLIAFSYFASKAKKVTSEGLSINLSGFLQMAIAIFIIASVIRMLSNMDYDLRVVGAIGIMFVITKMLQALMATAMDAGEHAAAAIKSYTRIAIALLIMVLAFKLVKNGDFWGSVGAIGILTTLTIMLGALMYVGKIAGKYTGDAIRSYRKIATALFVLAVVVAFLGYLDQGKVWRGIGALAGIALVAGLLVYFTRTVRFQDLAPFFMMSVAIGILAVIAVMLGHMDPANVWIGIAAVAALATIAVLVTRFMKYSYNVDSTPIIKMAIAIGILALIAVILSNLDLAGVLIGIGAIAALSYIAVKIIKFSNEANQIKIKPLIAMIAIMAAMAIILHYLGSLNPENAIASAGGIAILLAALVITFKILQHGQEFQKGQLAGTLVVLAAITGVMAAFAYMLVQMDGIDANKGTKNAKTLGALMIALAITMRILPKQGISLSTVGSLALLALAIAGFMELVVLILYQMESMDLKRGTQNMEIMGTMMVLLVACMDALTPLVAIMSLLGTSSFIGVAAVGFLGAVLEGLVALGTLILDWASDRWVVIGQNIKAFWDNISGALHEIENDNLEPAIDTLVSLVAKMMEVGGSDFWGWLGDGIASIFGGSTVDFAQEEFTSGMSSVKSAIGALIEINDLLEENPIDNTLITASLANVQLAVDAASGLSGVGNVEDVDEFYATAGAMIEGLVGFSDTVKANQDKIDPENAQKVADLCNILITLADGLPDNNQWNLLDSLIGRKDTLDEFGDRLPVFADGVVAFCEKIQENEDKIQKEYAEKASAIGTILSSLGKDLPDSNQWNAMDLLFGRKQTLDEFGNTLPVLADGIASFCWTMAINGGVISEDYAKKASAIGSILSALADDLPPEDGALQWWFGGGHTEMDDFGDQLETFGKSIATFCDSVKDISYTEGDGGGVDATIKIAQSLSDIAVAVQDVEDSKMNNFYNFLKNFGGYMKNFDEQIKDIDETKIVSKTVALVSMANALASVDNSTKFVEVATGFAMLGNTSIDGLVNAIDEGSEDVIAAIDGLITLVSNHITLQETAFTDAMKSAVSGFVNAIKFKGSQVKSAAISLTSDFISGLKDDTKINSIKSAGKSLVTALEDGIKSGMSGYTGTSSSSPTMFRSVLNHIDAGKTLINNKKADFTEVGKNLVIGLKDGIEDVYARQSLMLAIQDLGTKSLDKMKKVYNQNSPSKETYQIGVYFTQGLINGISSLGGEAVKASENLAGDTINAVSKTIANISAMVNDNIDTEPVIRPVLDLSNVQNGVKTIDSMFSANQAIRAGNGFNAGKEILVNGLVGSGGNSYNFTQNIYSPTALNRIDIYRQTKTQFSMALERMKHA